MAKDSEDAVMPGDKRKDLRTYLLILRVNGERDNIFFGYARNLSRSGMFISSVNPRQRGEEFEVSFKLPDDGTLVRCRCRVAWKREYDSKTKLEPGMGLEFIGLDPGIMERIDEWVRRK
ncbi:MAG: PilZ domain-containing protein [Deltaproteobacteria bacterium]|nr:PilZ domain-containing protein [Deltaproteobacteria bacterium]